MRPEREVRKKLKTFQKELSQILKHRKDKNIAVAGVEDQVFCLQQDITILQWVLGDI